MSDMTWLRGCSLNTTDWTFRGGPYPDDVIADVTMLYGPREPIEVSPGVFTGWVDPATQMRVDYHHGVDTSPRGFVPSGVGCNYMARGYGVVTRVIVGDPAFGNAVECFYPSGDGHTYRILGLHLRDAPYVSLGQPVTPDTVLGVTGATGYAKGGHMHEAAWRDDYAIDPLSLYNEAQPVGYRPPPPAEPMPVYAYPVPEAYWEWRGKGDQQWKNVWELRIQTHRPTTELPIRVDLIREGRANDFEIMRVEVEDWADGT